MYAYIYIEKSLWNKCKYYKVSDGKSFTLMWFCGFIYYIACKGGCDGDGEERTERRHDGEWLLLILPSF